MEAFKSGWSLEINTKTSGQKNSTKMKPNAEFALRITDFFKTSSRADK